MDFILRKKLIKSMKHTKKAYKLLLKFKAQTEAAQFDQQNALNALDRSYNAMIDFLMNF